MLKDKKMKCLLPIVLSAFVTALLMTALYVVMMIQQASPISYSQANKSQSGQFMLLESSSQAWRVRLFSVIPIPATDDKLLYTTPTWFSGRWPVKELWGNMNDDFFVLTSDIGPLCYVFNGSTWDEYSLKKHAGSDDYYLRPLEFSVINNDRSMYDRVYSKDNIPEEVIQFFK